VGIYQSGDQLKAIIVPAPEISLSYNDPVALYQHLKWEVMDEYNKKCSSYKKVLDFSVLDGELPRTRLGKIQRFKLPEFESKKEETSNKTEEVVTQEYSVLASYLEKEKQRKVYPYNHLEMDLGLDSLDKVSLQVFINSTFGVDIDSGEMMNFKHILALSEFLKENKSRLKVEKIDWTNILKEKVHISLPKTWLTGRALVKISNS
jgi:long-chain acyl-CoA synthetase